MPYPNGINEKQQTRVRVNRMNKLAKAVVVVLVVVGVFVSVVFALGVATSHNQATIECGIYNGNSQLLATVTADTNNAVDAINQFNVEAMNNGGFASCSIK